MPSLQQYVTRLEQAQFTGEPISVTQGTQVEHIAEAGLVPIVRQSKPSAIDNEVLALLTIEVLQDVFTVTGGSVPTDDGLERRLAL